VVPAAPVRPAPADSSQAPGTAYRWENLRSEETVTSDGVSERFVTACRQAGRSLPEDASPLESIGTIVDRIAAASGDGSYWSVFMLEHGRLWSIVQRGYTMIPDGLAADRGIMARAARTGRAQSVPDVAADPDYVSGRRGIVSEVAVPLKTGSHVIGMLNFESERSLPAGTARALQPVVAQLSELVDMLRHATELDLPALARLFIHLSSLRDPSEIATLATQSLARVLDLDTCRIVLRDDEGNLQPAASWTREGDRGDELPLGVVEILQAHVDVSAVFDRVAVQEAGIGALAADCETFVWLPLRANGVQVGVFVGAWRVGGTRRRPDAELASLLAAQTAAAIDGAQALGRERRSASTDSLTGLLNRRGFDDRLEAELERAAEERAPLSLCVLDCDEFKSVNDRGGHERGDRVLADLGAILGGLLEPGDAAARLGGDEFAVMLPCTDVEAGLARAETMRAELARGLSDAGTPLEVSIGVATYPFDGATGTQLMRAADQGLYVAKASGKDLVVAFRDLGAWHRRAAPRRDRRAGERASESDLGRALAALAAETTPEGALVALCRALTSMLTASAALVSRLDGERIVDGV